MDGFIGEVRAFAFGYEPQNWLLCDGRVMPLQQSQALYAVIGNTYGGTAGSTFQLPNLQTVAVLGAGSGPGLSARPLAQASGAAAVQLTVDQLPAHNHLLTVQSAKGPTIADATLATPKAQSSWLGRPAVLGTENALVPAYVAESTAINTTLQAQTVANTGGVGSAAQAHENRQPFLTLGYYICVDGVYPVPA